MTDVTGVGADSMDHVLRLPGDVAALLTSGKARIVRQQWSCGGQTATAMSACAALGLSARYIGAFGSDDHGRRLRSELASRGVDVSDAVDGDAPNPGAVVVVDDGGRRTVLWHRDARAAPLEGDRFHLAPAMPVKAVDTTGAGDVFRAGVIYGLLQGWAVPALLRFANAAAALSCTREGAIASVPTLAEIKTFLA